MVDPEASTVNPFSSISMATQSSTSSILDKYLNPYFLHHFDSMILVFVSDLLTESNYTSQSHAMILGLTVKNKLEFIDGTFPKSTGDLKNSWIIRNNVVSTWLMFGQDFICSRYIQVNNPMVLITLFLPVLLFLWHLKCVIFLSLIRGRSLI